MPTSITELNQFVEFATGALNAGADEASIEQLLKQWRAQREEEETVELLRQRIEKYDANPKSIPIAEAFSNIRKRLGMDELISK